MDNNISLKIKSTTKEKNNKIIPSVPTTTKTRATKTQQGGDIYTDAVDNKRLINVDLLRETTTTRTNFILQDAFAGTIVVRTKSS